MAASSYAARVCGPESKLGVKSRERVETLLLIVWVTVIAVGVI